MNKQIILIILVLSISKLSLADWAVQGIQITCNAVQFKVESYNLVNEDPSSNIVNAGNGMTRYFGNKEHTTTCKIDKITIDATFKTNTPKARGACGGAPGTNVSISVNGIESINALFNNECTESLDSVKLEDNRYVGYKLEFCGHTSSIISAQAKGCFEFRHQYFDYLTLPISGRPLSTILKGSWIDPEKN